MNYDIHVGAIGGIPGKIIAFLLCLISGSLPVTGFIIWFDKKRRGKSKLSFVNKKAAFRRTGKTKQKKEHQEA